MNVWDFFKKIVLPVMMVATTASSAYLAVLFLTMKIWLGVFVMVLLVVAQVYYIVGDVKMLLKK